MKKNRYVGALMFLSLCVFCLMFSGNVRAAEKKGWVTESGSQYYYVNGKKVTGLKKIGAYTYYFRRGTGVMLKNRWLSIGGKYYYFLSNGRMAKSRWIGLNYYVGKSGVRATNTWVDGKFLGEDGRWIQNFKGGWQKINGKWYYYTASGKKRTGWITYKSQRYYLDKDGVRVTRFTTINKKNYYFTKMGILQRSTWVKRNGLYYRANEKGVVDMTEGYNTKDPSTATRIVYKSSTLTVDLRKQYKYSTYYWTARVQVKDTSQLRSSLSYGTYGGLLETTTSALRRNVGVIGINGSRFDSSGKPGYDAVLIKKGRIYNRALGTSYSLMAITKNGIMYTPEQGLSAEDLIKDGVWNTFDFGPTLIKNGVSQKIISPFEEYMSMPYPRSAVGMIRPGDYVLLVCDGKGTGGSRGLTHYQLCSIFKSFGCTYAYNLDGGGSSTLVYRGRVLNNPSDGSERAVGDFLYFTR